MIFEWCQGHLCTCLNISLLLNIVSIHITFDETVLRQSLVHLTVVFQFFRKATRKSVGLRSLLGISGLR